MGFWRPTWTEFTYYSWGVKNRQHRVITCTYETFVLTLSDQVARTGSED